MVVDAVDGKIYTLWEKIKFFEMIYIPE